MLRDSTFNNISSKNNNYCELTAAYWIWKNYTEAEYVGICHYRRYLNFYNPIYNFKPSAQKEITIKDFKKTKLYNASTKNLQNKIKSILSKFDIILCKPYKLRKGSLTQNFSNDHRKEDLDLTKKIILEKYPEYKNSILKHLDEGTLFHSGNMMICSKKNFDDYNNWLFSILFELENKTSIPTDEYQARIFGFIAERLLNLYVYHNDFKIKSVPSYKINDL